MLPAASGHSARGVGDAKRIGRYLLGISARGWGYVYATYARANAVVRDVELGSSPKKGSWGELGGDAWKAQRRQRGATRSEGIDRSIACSQGEVADEQCPRTVDCESERIRQRSPSEIRSVAAPPGQIARTISRQLDDPSSDAGGCVANEEISISVRGRLGPPRPLPVQG